MGQKKTGQKNVTLYLTQIFLYRVGPSENQLFWCCFSKKDFVLTKTGWSENQLFLEDFSICCQFQTEGFCSTKWVQVKINCFLIFFARRDFSWQKSENQLFLEDCPPIQRLLAPKWINQTNPLFLHLLYYL